MMIGTAHWEDFGPTIQDVRDVLNRHLGPGFEDIVLEVIPDDKNKDEFGSWKGFFAFKLRDLLKECRDRKLGGDVIDINNKEE